MAHGAVTILSTLSSAGHSKSITVGPESEKDTDQSLNDRTLVMDGVGVGFLKRVCFFEKEYEKGNEDPFDDRDLSHMQEGSEFSGRMMIPAKKHRHTLARLVKTSNLAMSSKKPTSSQKSSKKSSRSKSDTDDVDSDRKECQSLLDWAQKSRDCLSPYLEVSQCSSLNLKVLLVSHLQAPMTRIATTIEFK
jgi:hypothetical protein